MRGRTLSTLATVVVLAAGCSSDPDPTESQPDTSSPGGDGGSDTSGAPDTATSKDTGGATDTATTTDGTPTDTSVPTDAPAPSSCDPGDVTGTLVLGGPAGTTNVYSIATDTTHTDGYVGTIHLAGKDIEALDIEKTGKIWVVDGTKIYTLGPWPYVAKGEYYVDATLAGDAPGIKALASPGPDTLFGAGGMTLYQIDVATLAVKTLYTVKTSGCTEILDFSAAGSGGGLVYDVFMQCGSQTKMVQVVWSDPSTTTSFSEDVPKVADVGPARAYIFGDVTIGAKVYQLKFGATAFTYIRDVRPCVDPTRLRGGR
jgi:hypothetical protein